VYSIISGVLGGGHGGDREVTINVKRGVEAKNYGDVSFSFSHHIIVFCSEHFAVLQDVIIIIHAEIKVTLL